MRRRTTQASTYLTLALTLLVLARHAAHLDRGLDFIASQHTIDDSYYYLETAWRHAHGAAGPTFDGHNPTSGVQPAWYLVVYTIAHLAGDRVDLLYGALLLCALLAALAVWLALGVARALELRWATILLPAFTAAMVCSGQLALSGMELPVALVAQLLLLRALASAWVSPTTKALLLSGLAAALALAVRVDSALWLLVLAGPLLWRARALGAPLGRATLLTVLPALAVAGLIALFFAKAGGSVIPVSVLWKARIAQPLSLTQAAAVVGRPLSWLAPFLPSKLAACAVVLPVIIGAAIALMRAPNLTFARLVVLVAGAGAAQQATLLLSGGSGNLYPFWYQAPSFLGAALLLTATIDTFDPHPRARLLVGGLCALLACATLATVTQTNLRTLGLDRAAYWSARNQRIAMARFIAKRFAPGTRFAAFNAGELGFYSRQPVTNLDGLANSYAYYRFRETRSALAFCRQQGIRYFVDYKVPPAFAAAGKVIARVKMLPRRPLLLLDLGPRR